MLSEDQVVEEGDGLVCPKGCGFKHRYKIFRTDDRTYTLAYYCPKEPRNIGGKVSQQLSAFNTLIPSRLATAV